MPKTLLLLAPILLAQAVSTAQPDNGAIAAQPAPAAAAVPACGCPTISALTPIRIEILTELGSKISKSGDTFPIRLAEPIVVDGHEMVPAGTMGMGEVVHAKKAGGSGAAGELVLAARYLDIGERHLKLRSMRLVPEGNSKINTVNTLMVATSPTILAPVALAGFFINGGQATVPQGTIAEAKIAEAFEFPAPAKESAVPEATPPAEAGKTGEKDSEAQ
ncbi:MAG: hypothetical protein J7485_09130 [Sphingobium sp.]|nr:hypothetical protein [Sphingobium sp.]